MKSLLNITVLISSVLSIFSASLTLYDVPVLKESISAIDSEEEVKESSFETDMKRIYISHDTSNIGAEQTPPLLVAKTKQGVSNPNKDSINVFGVQVPNKNTQSNI